MLARLPHMHSGSLAVSIDIFTRGVKCLPLHGAQLSLRVALMELSHILSQN